MFRFATAWMSALSTPKSPQPGHQSGLVSLLYFDNSIIFYQQPLLLCSQFHRRKSARRHTLRICPLFQIRFFSSDHPRHLRGVVTLHVKHFFALFSVANTSSDLNGMMLRIANTLVGIPSFVSVSDCFESHAEGRFPADEC